MPASDTRMSTVPVPEGMEAAYAAFVRAYPDYATTHALDELRASEYARLDEQNQVYLDYTGGGLYAESQVREHVRLLSRSVFGNPHSENPTSLAMTRLIAQARARVLEFFNASPAEYVVIFTANASAALKLVGEAYPFGPGDQFLLTFDNHNSVNGIREFARAKRASFGYLPVVPPDLRVDPAQWRAYAERAKPGGHNLFAFPAQSNFSGVQHPLEMIAEAHARGWDVLVDAAAFVPTNRFDLTYWKPDWVSLSFYKMFGYPTGVGCLLARRTALRQLKRPWYAGGTITISSVQGDGHYLAEGEAGFEDGTVNYLSLPAVEIGLRHLAAIGLDQIHTRVRCLTGALIDWLVALRHSNGQPMAQIYGPSNLTRRGGTVAATFYDVAGRPIDDRRIEELANRANISLRTGCFCNPGAGEIALGLNQQQMSAFFASGKPVSFRELRAALLEKYHKQVGAVRISVGMVTNYADIYRFMRFVEGLQNRSVEEFGPTVSECCHPWTEREST